MNILRFRTIQAVVAAGLLLGSAVASASTISLLPADQAVPFPGTFSINIFATDLPDSTTGGSLNVSWTAADMTLDLVTIANPPWDLGFSTPGTIGAGTLTNLSVAQFGGVVGNALIATLNFTLDQAGVVDSLVNVGVGIEGWSGVDPGNNAFFFDNTYVGATINPATAPIPVPAAVWLFGSGLLGLVGVARRRG